MTENKSVVCFKNAEEIGKYIGESKNSITQLVLEEGLPAWKRNGCGPWRALSVDLDKWIISQRNKYLTRSVVDAEIDRDG
ncbi:hypothetical protein Dvar_36250 [Desulfosarcina variabilis str. Montpellier]|jgi:hypothetical protein|uniref:hypothetical protein n=1 Tax=Desulfosarcina variabilis TaxID=2300 RepID=UPI003AFA84AA